MALISKTEKELLSDPARFYDDSSVNFFFNFDKLSGAVKITSGYFPCFNDFMKVYSNDIARNFSCPIVAGSKRDLTHNNNREPRPEKTKTCIILVHGFQSKQKKIYLQMAERYSKKGIDCLVYSLPFHFERNDHNISEISGFLDTGDLRVTFELFRQSVIELQMLIKALKMSGYKKVGAMGFSFGGYCCSIAACVCNEIDFIIPLATIGDFSSLLVFKKGKSMLDENNERQRLNKYLAENFLNLICPICFYPLSGPERILMLQGIFDHRAPFSDVAKLRKKWDYPTVIWYPCGHFTFFLFNRITLKFAYNFINKMEGK